MSPYENLLAHIDEHKYLRGAHKGDAPLDPKRRRKSENRVTNRGAYAAVIRWHTEILQAYPDGRVVLNCDGWGSSMTTRLAMNYALSIADVGVGWLHSVRYKGVSQLALGQWRYYDGMALLPSPDGYKPTVLQSFRGRRKDKSQTQEFRGGMKTSGFNALFPVLYLNATTQDRPMTLDTVRLSEALTDPSLADQWPRIVAYYKFDWVRMALNQLTNRWERVYEEEAMNRAYQAMVRAATAHMNETYDTEVFSL
jgi:hypothetical protein